MPPMVPAFHHGHVVFGPLDDQYILNGRAALEGFIDRFLQRHNAASTPATIGGDNAAHVGIVYPITDGRSGETTKDDGVHGADASTGQHGDGQFGDHGHIDSHTIALFHAHLLQAVGCLANAAVQLLIGEDDLLARLPFPDDGGLVLTGRSEMAIEAVVGNIRLAAFIPLHKGHVVFVTDAVPLLKPVQLAGHIAPESFRVFNRLLIQSVVGFPRWDRSGRRKICGRFKETTLFQDVLNLLTHGAPPLGTSRYRCRCAVRGDSCLGALPCMSLPLRQKAHPSRWLT